MTEEMKTKWGNERWQKPGKNFGKWQLNKLKVRKMLQDLDAQMKSNGQGKKQIQDIIDAMDQIEKRFANRRLTNEMLRRQQDIMVASEEERAQKEQDKDEQRKATSLQQQSKIPPSMQEYIRKKEAELMTFARFTQHLLHIIKRLVEQYYNQLSGKNETNKCYKIYRVN